MVVDLHTHTTASDGTLRPRELVRLAKKQRLKGLAITDHDTVDGIPEGLASGREYKIEVLPGLELSTSFGGHEVHILGYLINWETDSLKAALAEMTQQRLARAKKMLSRLSELGFSLDFSEIQRIAGEGVIGRPHLATAMVQQGYVSDVREAFASFLGKGAPAYVAREKLSLKEAIQLLKEAKGIPVLAHPGLIGDPSIIESIIEMGLMGIEVFYPEHSIAQRHYFLDLCQLHGLIATGGSDFHGPIRTVNLGTCGVSPEVVKQLRRKQEEYYG
ncbi:MAG: PHP domain-containing protein [Clostridia bacterium]|jgi:predicted metal-dependent phosphoesterase TrpH|nr:PHP domain-containing protein [Clostridia bacterium]